MVTVQEIFNLFIQKGIDADPRGREGIEKILERVKKDYEELPEKKKKEFDLEELTNPYSDSRILFGDGSTPIRRVMVGIDITGMEVLLADRLREKGQPVDLLISHHPAGAALAALDEVMTLQSDLVAQFGVPINVAEALLGPRMGEVRRRIAPANHFQTVDIARILGIPLMCIHTPSDNQCYKFLKDRVEEKQPERVKDVVEMLKEVPEYAEAVKMKTGPTVFVGSENNRCGKIVPAEVTGGTEGAIAMYEKMAQAGVGTIIGMHASEEHRKEAEKHHINLVIAGHMSSDSLGMNQLMDELERRGVEVIPCSGLIRVSRNRE